MACQIGLTLIAGAYIRTSSASFKMSLIGSEERDAVPLSMTPVDWAAGQVEYLVEDSARTNYGWLEYLPMNAKAKVEKCCNGAECAAMHLRCCDRSDVLVGPANATNESTAGLLLVGARNTVEETKPSHFGRSWDEMCRYHHDKTLECTPPSFAFLDAWDDLDSNGDGIWSFEEARADQANLGCRFGVSVDEMFRSACKGIVADAQDTASNSYNIPLVPAEIEKRKAIPRGYFEWWRALVVICATPDLHRCSGLVSKGMFDGAIRMARETQVTRGGVVDLDSALDFCQRLLMRNGICEKTLPGTYLMYRSRASAKCGSPVYSLGGKYHNPYDDRDVMHIMSIDYSTYSEYVMSSEFHFQVFLFLILLVWYVSLLAEFKQILELYDFTRNFKVNRHSALLTASMQFWVERNMTGKLEFIAKWLLPESKKMHGDHGTADDASSLMNDASGGTFSETFSVAWRDMEGSRLKIKSHSRLHSNICWFMFATRFCTWFYLADVGTAFIIYIRDYEELLMNAVGLAFIVQLPEFLYVLLVPDAVKDQLSEASTRPFPTSFPPGSFGKHLLSPISWGLIFIPFCAAIVVFYNLVCNTRPFLEALECACYMEGDSCNAAPWFQKGWWDAYWQDLSKLAKHRSSWLDD
jgi:hypothetical protein